MYRHFFKRVLDFLITLIALIVASPLLLIICIFLYFSNDGSVFFFQQRPGLNGKIFRVMKFKTMNDRKNANGELLPDADRLTATGRFLRSTSLDELPQLINVVKGDMSLIGPRPLLVRYLPLYSEHQARRHEVKPGITGWAQVNGRNAISWEQKFDYDVWYVDNISFYLDLKIILLTIKKVILRKDINSGDTATTHPFDKNN